LKVMIVEDEMLLAMELESEVEALGHEIVGIASSSTEAAELLSGANPDFAFVDIHLMDGPTGIEVGKALAARGVSYVFVSGNIKKIPEDFAGAIGAIEKPYTVDGMRNALEYLSAVIAGDKNIAPPASLMLAPPGLKTPRLRGASFSAA